MPDQPLKDPERAPRRQERCGRRIQSHVRRPTRLERWPVTVAFVEDPDGYTIELLQRHEA